ncbi:hypothetical protein VTH06DRAFT_7670 [Thermothelomyces fergusii]
MDDLSDRWQTVMPTSHARMKRLPYAQLEECELKILRDWEASGHHRHWSGIGKHLPADDLAESKKAHSRFELNRDKELGRGASSSVDKVKLHCNNWSIYLARKVVWRRSRRHKLEDLRNEVHVMENLDHHHIVKLVGTYYFQDCLYFLLWPVAVCNLDKLLGDIDRLRKGQGDREDIISRLHELDLQDLSAVEGQAPTGRDHCPLEYLRRIMGCVTTAVAYCHKSNVRHLDLKPENILLNPGRVYLADFGVAKDVHGRANTMTIGARGTREWWAPEVQRYDAEWSMKAADVYSLGLILLNILTVIYNAPLNEFEAVLEDVSFDGRAMKLDEYLPKLERVALASQEVDDANAAMFGPKHIINLAARMVSRNPSSRPVISQVDSELVELGGFDQVYHSKCGKRSSRYLTECMSARLKAVAEERDRLAEERDRLREEHGWMAKRVQILEAKDETYEQRLQNERKAQAETLAKLQAQLDKERAERQRLEDLLSETQPIRKQHRLVPPKQPSVRQPPARASSPPAQPKPQLSTRAIPQQRLHATPLQQPRPAPLVGEQSIRPSYSQCLKTAAPSQAATVTAKAIRDSLIPPPSPSAILPRNSSSDQLNFTLRSRSSGSRLPRAVNPATPIRSNTPVLNHDLSSADSTQYGMNDSVFSRLSLSKASLAGTSISGTPSAHSPVMADTRKATNQDTSPPSPCYGEPGLHSPPEAEEPPHGLGLGLIDRERRDSVRSAGSGSDRNESVGDTAGTISASAAKVLTAASSSPRVRSSGTRGLMLSPSRATHGSIKAPVREAVRGPLVPKAQSWAEIAART